MKDTAYNRWQQIEGVRIKDLRCCFIYGSDPAGIANIRYHFKKKLQESGIATHHIYNYPPEGEAKCSITKYSGIITRHWHEMNLIFQEEKAFFLTNIQENSQKTKKAKGDLAEFIDKIKDKPTHRLYVFHIEDSINYRFLLNKTKNPLLDYCRKEGLAVELKTRNFLFSFIDAYMQKNLREAYKLWKELEKQKEDPKKLLNLIIRNLRFQLELKTFKSEAPRKEISAANNIFRQHPFVQQKAQKIQYRYNTLELMDLLEEAHQAHILMNPDQLDLLGYRPAEIFNQFLVKTLAG